MLSLWGTHFASTQVLISYPRIFSLAQQLRPQCDPPVPGPRKDPYVPCIDGRINDVFSVSIIVKIALENLVKKNRLLIIWPSFPWELFLLFSCLDFPLPHVRSDNHVF